MYNVNKNDMTKGDLEIAPKVPRGRKQPNLSDYSTPFLFLSPIDIID